MDAQDNAAIVRDLFAAFNDNDLASLACSLPGLKCWPASSSIRRRSCALGCARVANGSLLRLFLLGLAKGMEVVFSSEYPLLVQEGLLLQDPRHQK